MSMSRIKKKLFCLCSSTAKELNKTYAHHLRSVTHLTFFSFFFTVFITFFFQYCFLLGALWGICSLAAGNIQHCLGVATLVED